MKLSVFQDRMQEVTVIERCFLKTVNVIQRVKNQAHSSLRKTNTQLTNVLTAYFVTAPQ